MCDISKTTKTTNILRMLNITPHSINTSNHAKQIKYNPMIFIMS